MRYECELLQDVGDSDRLRIHTHCNHNANIVNYLDF